MTDANKQKNLELIHARIVAGEAGQYEAAVLWQELDLAAASSPQAPAPQGIPGDILEHEYRHEHGLLALGECQTHHCVGTFWTEQEIAVIDKLSKRQELSHVAVLRGALRNYQLLIEGVPQLPDKAKECEEWQGGYQEQLERAEAATGELDALRRELRFFEWSGIDGGTGEAYCPKCGNHRSKGHTENCSIRAALGAVAQEKPK